MELLPKKIKRKYSLTLLFLFSKALARCDKVKHIGQPEKFGDREVECDY